MAARYPWFEAQPPEQDNVLPNAYPNLFNVDIASPAAYEEPIDVFIGNQLKRGIFPMWNPYIACGTIVQEQFSTRSLFPYQLLQNICPWNWRDFFLLGRLFFASIGVFVFLKLLEITFLPSLCGGIMYGLSGAMTVFLTLTQMSNVGMVLPYTLIGMELLFLRQSVFSIIFSGLATALLILGGQPEVAFYSLIFICAYYFFRIMSASRETRIHIIKKVAFLFLSIVIALLISSPSFIPFLINSGQYYSLHPPGGQQGVTGVTSIVNFISIFLPELLRWRSRVFGITVNSGWDRLGGYIGFTGIFLILASIRKYRRIRKEFLFFLGSALFILLKNLGVPIINWIGRLPIFDQIWTPRWTGPIWNLSLIISAVLGFQALLLDYHKKLNENGNLYFTKPKLWKSLMPIITEIAILSLGILINVKLWQLLLSISIVLGLTAVQLWDLSLILLATLGFLLLFLIRDKKLNENGNLYFTKPKLWKSLMPIITEIAILSLGILINAMLWIAITWGPNEILRRLPGSTQIILRVFCITMTAVMLFRSTKRIKFSPLFIALCFTITLCIFNFQPQARTVGKGYSVNLLEIRDKIILLSMWQSIIQSTVFALIVLLGLFLAFKHKFMDKNKFAFIISGIILIEMSYHVNIGYNESGRLIILFWHLAALMFLISYSLSANEKNERNKGKFGLCLFVIGMVLIGAFGLKCMPSRGEFFKNHYNNSDYNGFSRIMGTRGIMFPNSSAAFGVQDIKSIVSLSIKRFQLFQDYCLSAKPQAWHKSLWFTGIMDPGTGKDISDNLREKYPFYSLAGVSNYLSPQYEDIPYAKLIQDGPVKNYQNLAVLPRAFIIYKCYRVNTPEDALGWMLSHPLSLNSEAVVEGKNVPFVLDSQNVSFTEARIKSYSLHSLLVEAETNTPGLLILTDTYHPGWQVVVDGKLDKIFPADLCFRGVFLSPGKHEVKFSYVPKIFYLCTALSFITLLTLFLLGIKSLRSAFHRKNSKELK